MASSTNKTRPTPVDAHAFIAAVESDQRRCDAERLLVMMQEVTGDAPVMWGPSIIGFGTYHYVYESGREGDAPLAGFSPRKTHMVVYLIGGYEERYPQELARLGPYRAGNSCLYFRKLDDLDEETLRFLIRDSYDIIRAAHA